MRTNYVLIDFESLQPEGLELLAAGPFQVMVFVGAQQHRIPFAFAQGMQRLGTKAEYIKIAGTGPNALDFHIAFHIGRLSERQSDAFFHVISHDTGFDPLIAHLKARGVFSARWEAITDIPHVRAGQCQSTDERLALVLARLTHTKASRPRRRKTLATTINSLFQNRLDASDLQALLDAMVANQYITFNGDAVVYGSFAPVDAPVTAIQ